MDSIGDNVMAIICVVVGILIIGCALVPIVDNASVVEVENTTYEPTSGYNSASSDANWFGIVDSISIVNQGRTITVNGEVFDGNLELKTSYSGTYYSRTLLTQYNAVLRVYPAFDSSLTNYAEVYAATATYANGVLSITGDLSAETTYSHSENIENLWVNYALDYSTMDETNIYGLVTSPFVIGEGQTAKSQNGNITLDTSSTEFEYGTITHNDDGTVTVTSSVNMYAPYKWTGTLTHTETTTTDSEYKTLYGIIPVLCILGMAYVLIRRFY